MVRINLEPDADIAPGHQWLMIEDTAEGRALAMLLYGRLPTVITGAELIFPHNHVVDQNIVDLINALAHVRFQSPTLVQLTVPSGIPQTRKLVSGIVYLIAAENGLYKIGKAINLGKRFRTFSVHFPMKWKMIHSFRSRDYTAAEAALHEMYKDKRDVGEWFRLSNDDVAYIKTLTDFALDAE